MTSPDDMDDADERLFTLARGWAKGDVEPVHRATLERALASRDLDELRRACRHPLEFGTAGLRGSVGAGPGRMNLAVVGRACWALGDFLRARAGGPVTVVFGYDARPDSLAFATFGARVLAGLGVKVSLSNLPVPTPIISYAVRKLGANAGVVLTASHNPRPDNGLKVFDHHGAQIVTPWDVEIARLMALAPPAKDLVLGEFTDLTSGIIDDYLEDAVGTATFRVPLGADPDRKVRAVYSPLHGVGGAFVERALEKARLPVDLRFVPAQSAPDGTFPTLPFPNPEEPFALDLLFEEAQKARIDVGCAHDPDADRLAVCLPLGGVMTRLSGDALDLLLASACLESPRVSNTSAAPDVPSFVTTVVSSPAFERLVQARGGHVIRTLTGFKYLCHAALEVENFAFAYEEALGYCIAHAPGRCGALDKDGIVALLVFLRMLIKEGGGEGLSAKLLSVYREVGLWGSFGISRRFVGSDAILEMKALVAELGRSPPLDIEGLSVTAFVDYAVGAEGRPWYLGAQDLLQFELSGVDEAKKPLLGRVLIRPSGTEAKVKAYVHLRYDFDDAYSDLMKRQERIAERIAKRLLHGFAPASPGRDESV